MGVKLVKREGTTLAQRSTRGSTIPLSTKSSVVAAQRRYESSDHVCGQAKFLK